MHKLASSGKSWQLQPSKRLLILSSILAILSIISIVNCQLAWAVKFLLASVVLLALRDFWRQQLGALASPGSSIGFVGGHWWLKIGQQCITDANLQVEYSWQRWWLWLEFRHYTGNYHVLIAPDSLGQPQQYRDLIYALRYW